MEKQQYLTKNQQIVLDLVEKSSEPLKAYSILWILPISTNLSKAL